MYMYMYRNHCLQPLQFLKSQDNREHVNTDQVGCWAQAKPNPKWAPPKLNAQKTNPNPSHSTNTNPNPN